MFTFFKLKKHVPDWSFQSSAISSLVKDFKKDPLGRFLLVLPTGGGKTLTAIRTLSEMINKGILSRDTKILWIVHTLSLKYHAEGNLKNEKNYSKFSLNPLLKSLVEVKMKADALTSLKDSIGKYKFIVIDEAHHAAASSYQEFFEFPLGILGLTATPRRMDSKGLPFEKISYSITFRELIRRKVVLLPKFLPEITTGLQIDVSSLDDDEQLEKFNNQERNQFISSYIFDEFRKHDFKKVIVFAGTNAHVKRLYEIIKKDNEDFKNPFEHVGYIYGGNNNEKNISNNEYLEWHHSQSSSILINCKILNEGYDDPNIDTVVMATPTNSILYYLQCIGRVVRTPENFENAKAYVLEIVDRLPNVSYRIDNKWLFAEISDYLEPKIKDIKGVWLYRIIKIFTTLFSLKAKITDLRLNDIREILIGKKISMLLFNDVPENKLGKWRIFPLRETDLEKIEMFNELSENIEEYYPLNHEYLLDQKYPFLSKNRPFNDRVYFASFMGALHKADLLKQERKKVDSLYYLSVY